MVQWAVEHVPSSDNPTVLEIGSGNGTLLFSLIEEENYSSGLLCGIDYSEDAVNLARNIAKKRDIEHITFSTCDFLMQDPPPISEEQSDTGRVDIWDLLLDKGTYDAIALGEKDELGRPPTRSYPLRTARLIKPGGFFLITCEHQIDLFKSLLTIHAACNFTEQELKTTFATEETELIYQYVLIRYFDHRSLISHINQFKHKIPHIHLWRPERCKILQRSISETEVGTINAYRSGTISRPLRNVSVAISTPHSNSLMIFGSFI